MHPLSGCRFKRAIRVRKDTRPLRRVTAPVRPTNSRNDKMEKDNDLDQDNRCRRIAVDDGSGARLRAGSHSVARRICILLSESGRAEWRRADAGLPDGRDAAFGDAIL